ncbi:MAG: efflux RND transporter permease subunit [Pseudomonadota bacterium]
MRSLLFERPRYLALALLMVVALGASALTTIGRQEDPTITNLFAVVLTPYPGASPARVEALVTEKIEAELREIAEIDEINSTSSVGISSIQIQLSDFLPDERIEQVWSEVRDALSDAEMNLPAGAGTPEFDNDRTGAYTAIIAINAREGGAATPGLLTRFAKELQDRLRAVPNTKIVELFGDAEEEIRVTLDPDIVASLGLTPDQVAAAIAAADAKVSAGRVRGASSDYLIEVAGEIDSLSRIRAIPLVDGADERIARVGDVATVSRTTVEPESERAYADGDRAVLIAARMENDRQVDAWASALRDRVDRFEAELPAGLELDLVFEQSDYTSKRLGEVAGNMAVGVALVVAVLFVTMGWRAAAIVGIMLPLTSLLSLAVLERMGVTIHQMSVTGLIVALGLLVDAAIVTTDEIRRRLLDGVERLVAVRETVGRLAVPLAASTITTVLAFVPMAALPGPAGDFVGAIALAVIVMLFASLLLALTVTPAIAGRLLPATEAAARRWWRDGTSGGWIARAFRASLGASLRWRTIAMLAAATPAIVGFMAFPTLTAQFFPGVERDQFHVQVDLPDGTALSRTDAVARKVADILAEDPAIRGLQWTVGRSAPAFYYNMNGSRDRAPGHAEILVTTASSEATAEAIPRLQTRLDAEVPEAQVLVLGLKQGPPVNAPVEMRLVGSDLNALREAGEMARAAIAEAPNVIHTRTDLDGGAPKLVFTLDEEKVRLAGLSLGEVARQLQSLSAGAVGGSLVEGSEELPVRVRVAGAARSTADDIAALTIVPPDGAARAAAGAFPGVSLAALGEVTLEPSESAISRRNGERVNTVQAFLTHGVLPEETLAAFRARLAAEPLDLPRGVRIEWGGDSDARGEVINNLLSVVGVVITGTIAAIVLTFNSWRLSAVAFVVAGLSMGLSMLALAIFGYPFGIQAVIGVIGSIGVSINAAIIIMTALQEDPGAALGDKQAIRDVVMRSGRHIVSTTITTFGGFLPLILAGGGFWPPFAMAIAGGVLLSTIVSFFFVPPAYSLLVPPRRREEEVREAPTALPLAAE